MKENMSALTRRQKAGYLLLRFIAWAQAWVVEALIGEPVWRSSDGTCTPYTKLKDGHLRNIIIMLLRTGDEQGKLPAVLAERARRRDAHK